MSQVVLKACRCPACLWTGTGSKLRFKSLGRDQWACPACDKIGVEIENINMPDGEIKVMWEKTEPREQWMAICNRCGWQADFTETQAKAKAEGNGWTCPNCAYRMPEAICIQDGEVWSKKEQT